MAIYHNGVSILKEIDKFFKMKPGLIGDPNVYLGTKLRKYTLPNGVIVWAISPSKYIHESIRSVEEYLMKEFRGRKLLKRAPTPFPRDHRPELDTTPELSSDKANYYQLQIGILRWMVELGKVDMITEVSLLVSQLVNPREGHLEAIYRMFAYLKNKHNSRMAFDPTYPEIDMSVFKKCDWKHFMVRSRKQFP